MDARTMWEASSEFIWDSRAAKVTPDWEMEASASAI